MYNLKLTEEQLKVIQEATNLLMRVQLGQWDEIIPHLPLQEDKNSENFYHHKRHIGVILSHYMKDNVDGISSSFGVGHEDLPKSNSVALDIHQTIRHYLSWKKAMEDGLVDSTNGSRSVSLIGVNYDTPLHLSDQPLPVIEEIDQDNPQTVQ